MSARRFVRQDSPVENGELLALAENKFDLLVTIDKNLRYQQNISGRDIAHFDCPCGIERSG
jgi:hypothetical protein